MAGHGVIILLYPPYLGVILSSELLAAGKRTNPLLLRQAKKHERDKHVKWTSVDTEQVK